MIEFAYKVCSLDVSNTDPFANPVINLAQNFVGANNINHLEPVGSFVSRRNGGEDAAEGRFVYTKLSALTRVILSACDDEVSIHHGRDGKDAELVVYIPVLPMILVNGCDTHGDGYSTFVPPYNPRDIVDKSAMKDNWQF